MHLVRLAIRADEDVKGTMKARLLRVRHIRHGRPSTKTSAVSDNDDSLLLPVSTALGVPCLPRTLRRVDLARLGGLAASLLTARHSMHIMFLRLNKTFDVFFPLPCNQTTTACIRNRIRELHLRENSLEARLSCSDRLLGVGT